MRDFGFRIKDKVDMLLWIRDYGRGLMIRNYREGPKDKKLWIKDLGKDIVDKD